MSKESQKTCSKLLKRNTVQWNPLSQKDYYEVTTEIYIRY